jgi:hypothetical protein
MTLDEIYILKIQEINNARNRPDHDCLLDRLNGWVRGVQAVSPDKYFCLIGDNFYLDQGIDRPMCCGVWLDWRPTE